MKMLSGKSVLIVVFLQLCFSAHVVKAQTTATPYQFGDLLDFPKLKFIKPVYDHYAVFVGGEHVEGKKEDQNIFEMIRKPPGCRFSKKDGPFKVVNSYYDSAENIRQSTPDMIKTIEELMSSDKCKKYSLLTGNCEHIATKVRYNKFLCKQKGTIVGPAARGMETVKASMGRKKKNRREASAAA